MKNYFTYLIACVVLNSFSQKQGNIWYFGNKAGLDFNSGNPVDISPFKIVSGEGCASIADTNGQLLFYTNGTLVYDKSHNKMPNGDGLKGDYSSTQSAIITPYPGNTKKYYIFTIRGISTPAEKYEFNFSVVDMDIKGNGTISNPKGDIIACSKNTFLTDNTGEKITAVMHADSISYWVVIAKYNANTFYAYRVSAVGVELTPVISSFSNYTVATLAGAGYMKTSTDGKEIAVGMVKTSLPSLESDPGLMLFDFDNSSGKLNNPRILSTHSIYGVEFSPNDSLIYGADLTTIYQYQRFASNIKATETAMYTVPPPNGQLALQLAPDGKIYFPRFEQNKLGRINNPNNVGSISVTAAAVTLGSGSMAIWGLPVYYHLPLKDQNTQLVINDTTNVCKGNSIAIGPVSNPIAGYQYFWTPENFLNNPSLANPIANPTATITYQRLSINACNDTIQDSVYTTVIINSLPTAEINGNDTICKGEAVTLSSAYSGAQYLWLPGNQTTSEIIVSEANTYFLKVTHENTCINYDTITVSFKECEASIRIPNIFTPNGDNYNDNYIIQTTGIETWDVKIYNRWGLLVSHFDITKNSWDGLDTSGQEADNGTYYYVLNGTSSGNRSFYYTGNFTLVK